MGGDWDTTSGLHIKGYRQPPCATLSTEDQFFERIGVGCVAIQGRHDASHNHARKPHGLPWRHACSLANRGIVNIPGTRPVWPKEGAPPAKICKINFIPASFPEKRGVPGAETR
jgi:hypothetical protein